MKRLPARPAWAISIAALTLVLAALAPDIGAALQGPPAVGQGPGGRGARGGGGGGGRGANTLGEGPWDIETETGTVHLELVTGGLDHPWGIVFLPNGDMLVTERGGQIRLIHDGALDPTPVGPLPEIRTGSLGGLLDIALHPEFEQNRWIYFTYSKPGDAEAARATTALARARYEGGTALTDLEDVFVADAYHGGRGAAITCCGQGPSDGSYGSRIVFDDEGYLYMTLGDRNYGEMSQNPDSDLGKIVRLNDDGSVPEDNPFVGMAAFLPEIYTLGHRNPLGLTIHPRTGELWSTEFGPRGGDELNRIQAGANYGWILMTEGMHYNGEPASLGPNTQSEQAGRGGRGMTDPVLFWAPSINPGNLIFYSGDRFPAWEGQMLMATMTRSLLRATFDDQGNPLTQERMLSDLGQRLRDIRQGPDGYIYLLTDETAGAVLRITSLD